MLSAEEMTRPCVREVNGIPGGMDAHFRSRYGWKEMIKFRGETLLYIFNSLRINILPSLKKKIWNGRTCRTPSGMSH